VTFKATRPALHRACSAHSGHYLLRRYVPHRRALDFFHRQHVNQLVLARAQPQLLPILHHQVWILERPVQPAERMPLARVDFHRGRDIFFDEARASCHIQHGLVKRDDAVRAKDARIGQDGHTGEAEAIARWRHVRRQDDVRGLAFFERRKRDTGADRTRFLKGVEIHRINLQAAGRSDLQAAPTSVALLWMQVKLVRIVFVFDDGGVRTNLDDALAGRFVGTFVGEPDCRENGLLHETV
jgi:hypothetical protein